MVLAPFFEAAVGAERVFMKNVLFGGGGVSGRGNMQI